MSVKQHSTDPEGSAILKAPYPGGTYLLRVGGSFYIGSTANLRRRRYAHRSDLNRGTHQCKELQAAFNVKRECEFVVLDFMRQGADESDESFRDRLRMAEQEVLDDQWGTPGLCNKSPNTRGPDNGALMVSRWTDPSYRAWMSALRKNRVASAETRVKMSDAKKGARHPKARAVIVTCPEGSTTRCDTVTQAAKLLGVSQQAMLNWLSGAAPWPSLSYKSRHWALYAHSARYAD